MKTQKHLTKQIALTGVLASQALALAYLEHLIPAIPGFPPGAKPGFSNIVVMFAASTLSVPQTLAIVIIKALFAGLTRGVTAFFMSLAGGLLSAGMAILLFRTPNKFGYIGIGVLCAVCHNLGQLCVAAGIAGTARLFLSYGPFLLLFAALTGCLTGTILKYVLPALNKQSAWIFKTNTNIDRSKSNEQDQS